MNTYITSVVLFFALVLCSSVYAQEAEDTAFSAFQSKATVVNTRVLVPTVVEVSFAQIALDRIGFLVRENQTGKLIPSYFKQSIIESEEPLFAQSVLGTKTQLAVDANLSTMFSIPVQGEGEMESIVIAVRSDNSITSSRLQLELDRNVILPASVKITAEDEFGMVQTIVATRALTSNVIFFPETTSANWNVTLAYDQPLRIAELRFMQEDTAVQAERSLRFLAQKGMTYDVFYNPDQAFANATAESGNLQDNTSVRIVQASRIEKNMLYIPADVDYDGVLDVNDNCLVESNADQEDIDSNGIGDVCDDFDRDAILNNVDNCVNDPNMSQQDEDGDNIGDVCDSEESRITERYMWVPWVGMGIAFFVLIVLFILVGTKPKQTPVV